MPNLHGTDRIVERDTANNFSSVKAIWIYLKARKSAAVRVEAERCRMASAPLKRHQRKGFLCRIVTGDEKWIYHDNPQENKILCQVWCSPFHHRLHQLQRESTTNQENQKSCSSYVEIKDAKYYWLHLLRWRCIMLQMHTVRKDRKARQGQTSWKRWNERFYPTRHTLQTLLLPTHTLSTAAKRFLEGHRFRTQDEDWLINWIENMEIWCARCEKATTFI